MSEHEAWVYLAEALRELVPTENSLIPFWRFMANGYLCSGLCVACESLDLNQDVYEKMLKRISKEAKKLVVNKNEFLWDSDPVGHQQRREFCLKMAELKKKKKKPKRAKKSKKAK